MDRNTKYKIVSALTQYDKKQSKKARHNPYALGIYLCAVDHVENCVDKGYALEESIKDAFSGRIRTLVLKAVGIEETEKHYAEPICRALLQED